MIYVEAFSLSHNALSERVSLTLAHLPPSPLTGPYKDFSKSSITSLFINYNPIDPSLLRGLPVISYSLEIDNGLGGDFRVVSGVDVDHLTTSQLI